MKASRILLVWATLALCGVLVIGAMAWLTRGVLASEKERSEALARADLEECTRLALWRLDAAGAAIVAGENRHPPAAYAAGASPFPAASGPWVKLHFELRENGRLVSPEAEGNRDRLAALRTLLGSNPLPGAEWALLSCAVGISETAWSQMPKDTTVGQFENGKMRQEQQRGGNRWNSDYQENFNKGEKVQRVKSVDQNISSNSIIAQQISVPDGTQSPADAPQGAPASPQIAELGAMRAIWIGGELFLLRQFAESVAGGTEKGVQGVWLDHTLVKQRLLSEVRDLLPNGDLTRATDAIQDPLALVSFPFRLVRNEAPVPLAPSFNAPLWIGWAAVILALLTASLLVHNIMRLSERRASFVSAVTHELRTPLTTFRLYSDMLESGAVKPEKRGDYLRVLSREADRLSHLVENVLSFSKIERGSARSAIRESTIRDLLEPIRERLEARLATAGMTLEMDADSNARVRVDAAAVEHILFNLADNAAKYASAGDPPLVIIRTETNGRHVGIRIQDHGPGIPASERRRIFRPFHKSAREAAESRPGVGLGLALSRRLAKSLGGSLEFADSPRGTCFVLRLPLATED